MQELLNIVNIFIRAVLRFKWIALFLTWVIACTGWLTIYQMDDIYRSNARIFVDSNRILKPLLRGIAVQPDVQQRVSLMSRTLLSRPNIEKLIRMTDIGITATTQVEKERQIERLSRQIQLRGERGNSSLYTVKYEHKDPEVAKKMVQSLITIFVESSIGDKRKDSESAQDFLDEQIVTYERRLASAELSLSDFKRENVGKMPGETGGYYQRLEVATSLARSAKLQLSEARNKLKTLQNKIRTEPRTLSQGGINSLSPAQQQLNDQKRELTELRFRYTERHPRIAQLAANVQELEDRVQQELLSGAPTSTYTSVSRISNPVYEEMRKLITSTEASVAELQVRNEEYEYQVASLAETVESIPKVEVELRRLNRDYDVVKQQYETLLQRRESARMSEQVEQNVDDLQFRVIDPPYVPSTPYGPNKFVFAVGALLAAVGAGIAAAIGLSFLMPVFYNSNELASITGKPVIGSILQQGSATRTTWSAISWVVYLAICALLFLIFLILVAYFSNKISLQQIEDLTGFSVSPERVETVVDQLVHTVRYYAFRIWGLF